MVARLRESARARKAAAVAYAKAMGIPVRVDTAFGTRELMAIRDGRPLYYTTHNENAGISTAADQVRSAYAADGAGHQLPRRGRRPLRAILGEHNAQRSA